MNIIKKITVVTMLSINLVHAMDMDVTREPSISSQDKQYLKETKKWLKLLPEGNYNTVENYLAAVKLLDPVKRRVDAAIEFKSEKYLGRFNSILKIGDSFKRLQRAKFAQKYLNTLKTDEGNYGIINRLSKIAKPSSWVKLRMEFLASEKQALREIPKKSAIAKAPKTWMDKSYALIKERVQKDTKYEALAPFLGKFQTFLKKMDAWKKNNVGRKINTHGLQNLLQKSGFYSKESRLIEGKKNKELYAARKLLRVTGIVPIMKRSGKGSNLLSTERKELVYKYLENNFESLDVFLKDEKSDFDPTHIIRTVHKMKKEGLLPKNHIQNLKGRNWRDWKPNN